MATSRNHSTPEVKLKRFLYISNEEPQYIAGDPESHNACAPEKLKAVFEVLNANGVDHFLRILEIVNSENSMTRRNNLFLLLSIAVCLTDVDIQKCKILTTVSNLIKNAEDLCAFIKYYTKQKKKFSSGIIRVIGSFYSKMDALELAHEVTKCSGYSTWKHKDLIKLSHLKSDSVLNTIVLTYILQGLPKAKTMAEENPQAAPIIEHLSKVEELKRTENESRVVELITDLHCNITRVPSIYHHSMQIWDALIPELSINDLIMYLPRLYKLGFLKAYSPFQAKVILHLTNPDEIKKSKIHAVEVFIGLRNFEKGGKPMDPKLLNYLETAAQENPDTKKPDITKEPPKCPNVISALHKAMQISFRNIQPLHRKIMITIDMTDKAHFPCLTTRNLTCIDAATILTLSFLRVENDVTVAVFNGTKITIVQLEKNCTFNQAVTKLKQAKRGFCKPSSPFEWALHKKKPVDVFIHLLSTNRWSAIMPKDLIEKEKPIDTLNTYRKKMSLPNSKWITLSLTTISHTVADRPSHILDIAGFNHEVPKIIDAYCKGLFC